MSRLSSILMMWVWCVSLFAPDALSAADGETLVVFVDSGARSDVARRFAEHHLPAIRRTADELAAPLTVIDIADRGAPDAVRITPLIVHQSPRGRAWFQGRYVDTGKLAHFIRTSRAVPPASGTQSKTDVAIWQRGRSQILAPIKVTSLQGAVPDGHDEAAFAHLARQAVLDGTTRFQRVDAAELGPSDRSFYMDFYPYADAEGRLFISTALFSQFHCIEPIFRGGDSPTVGTLAEPGEAFARAARRLEAEIARQVATSRLGDGFDAVPSATPIADWQALGLALPERTAASANTSMEGVELPMRWRIAEPTKTSGPRLIFRFPAPLERYSGEVARLRGELNLAAGHALVGAGGWIEADTASVTMGESSLDAAIHGKMIHVVEHPVSRFELANIASGAQPLAFGRTSTLTASGVFRLVGREIPLAVQADVEPVIGEQGQALLRVRAGFELRLSDPFGLAGPDGPAPARDTLVFYLDVLMESADADVTTHAVSPTDSP